VKPVLEDDEDFTETDGDDPAALGEGAIAGRAQPPPIQRFHRTAVGTALAAGLMGLRDVLEAPKDDTPAIVEQWAGREPFQDPIVLRLDPDHPEDSIVMVRRKPAPDAD